MTPPAESAVIIEMDQERDRKDCIALDLKATGGERDLAQWLLDHPRYAAPIVANWLGCGESRVKGLRRWAESGFPGRPFDKINKPRRALADGALKDNDNSEIDMDDEPDIGDEVASPEVIEDNLLYGIARASENARAYNRIAKASALDREAAERISTAIERMIQKWRSVQSTLAKKG